jgi:glucan phosphorylase
MVNDPKRPVQFLFAVKAHPHDEPGKKVLQQIAEMMRDQKFADKFVFIEDYDINVGRFLVQGVDVWLNNPRRPLEASGTSGQKVVLNGGLNLPCWTDGGPRPSTASMALPSAPAAPTRIWMSTTAATVKTSTVFCATN